MSDPIHGHYRTKEEIEEQKRRDPIVTFRERLQAEGMVSDNEFDEMEQQIADEMEDAVRFADESPDPELEQLYKDVYVD